jgi:hypothetical protein
MFTDWFRVLAFLAALAIAGAVGAPCVAEPRLLGINDLPESFQKILWERVDRVAGYTVILKVCASDPDFERRFVEAVQPCIEPDTVRRVVDFYRQRTVALDKRLSRNFCSDKNFVQNNWGQKLKSTLDNLVENGHNLCVAYLKTGLIGR